MSVVTFIAYGTRGDVQPVVALGKAIKLRGHTVCILAGANFADWIQQHDLIPLPTQIDMQALMASEGGRDWVEKGHNPVMQMRLIRPFLTKPCGKKRRNWVRKFGRRMELGKRWHLLKSNCE